MNLDSMKDILSAARQEGKAFWEIVLETDMKNRGVSRMESLGKMAEAWHAMREASELYTGERRSVSGLVGGQGKLMREYAGANPIGGEFTAQVIAEALSMGESNACMRRIVAAPTAGACGVLPAVLIPLYWRDNLSEDQMLEALFTASGIGAVIAYRACISGAAGGCQAEIGSASAMAAGALVYLRRGAGEQMCHAVAMALKNLMGLVCDPVAGLVEVPCVKRNVIGAVNAIAAADMALAGIESRIPVDEVIDAMGEVGRRLPVEFRETALGGLAATPTGKAVKKQLHGDKKKQRTLTIKDSRWKLERSEEAEEPAVKDSPKGKKGS
ncbi:MAG: L-serine ammonia-lyase, iron-sulfur-dependent, subunit alpha [Oscillospiraceae bacterium]|nr:L-serine ammonia-lyase, iron-sulfur-dependent, subunit alpha [Oscillospiraceae bacterium]